MVRQTFFTHVTPFAYLQFATLWPCWWVVPSEIGVILLFSVENVGRKARVNLGGIHKVFKDAEHMISTQ